MNKNLLLILLLFLRFNTYAQETIKIPTDKEWSNYLQKRIDGIQQKIYQLAKDSKIKAYKNDSLSSFYSRNDLLERAQEQKIVFRPSNYNNPEIGYDSLIVVPFNPKVLKGFCFTSEQITSPFETNDLSKLKSIGILYQPVIGGLVCSKQPLALFDPNEIQGFLKPNEFEFLKLYYYFCKHGDGQLKNYENYEQVEGNNFEELFSMKIQRFNGDSLQQKLIYSMFQSEVFYNAFFHKEEFIIDDSKIIFDEQEQVKISHYTFETNYQRLYNFFISDFKNPEIGYDTFEYMPFVINLPTHLVFNKDLSLEKLKYIFSNKEIENVASNKTKNEYVFTVSKADLIESGFQKVLIWFFEDYYRFLKE